MLNKKDTARKKILNRNLYKCFAGECPDTAQSQGKIKHQPVFTGSSVQQYLYHSHH